MDRQIEEARDLIKQAQELIRKKAQLIGNKYMKEDVISVAGNLAYKGVLVALDHFVPDLPNGERKSLKYYKAFLDMKDFKLLLLFNQAYNILHIKMGYDGNTNAKTIKKGFGIAETLIDAIDNELF